MKKFLSILSVMFVLGLCGCRHDNPVTKPYSKVMVLCSVGYDIISPKMEDDIEELVNSPFLPEKGSDKALLAIVHFPQKFGHFCDTDPTYLIQYSLDKISGNVIRDTLKTMYGAWLTSVRELRPIFEIIASAFPSDHYGLVYSSHGTGCLPPDYARSHPTRSIGFELGPNSYSREMDICQFPSSVPFALDYLILDACQMGGIETVYEFSQMAPYIVASPAEVPSEGFDYANMLKRLLCSGSPDVKGVAQDYFDLRSSDSSSYACVSMVRTDALPSLANICRELFSTYRAQILTLTPSQVQPMSKSEMRYLFDFADIIRKCGGVSQSDLSRLEKALDEVVVYKACTPDVSDFKVDNFCGLNSLLPSAADEQLKAYYRTLAWNKDTGFIQ